MGTVAYLGRFHPGMVLVTPAVVHALMVLQKDRMSLLSRHQCGDWGNLGDDDKESNAVSRNCSGVRAAQNLSATLS